MYFSQYSPFSTYMVSPSIAFYLYIYVFSIYGMHMEDIYM